MPRTVAVCSRSPVQLVANANCQVCGSIDNGSFDADGDPLTLSQNPGCDYDLGDTLVTLTVTDSQGANDSCTSTINVVDESTPTVACNAPAAMASDNCNGSPAVTIEITSFDCFFFNPVGKRVDKTDSCVVALNGDVITILDSGSVDDHIEWTVTASDNNDNTTTTTCEVLTANPERRRSH